MRQQLVYFARPPRRQAREYVLQVRGSSAGNAVGLGFCFFSVAAGAICKA
jgi:hypothetical protein